MNVALLLGLSLSADSFAVCCAMTACRQAGWKTALRLAGSFALFQALLPLAGWFLMNRLGWLLKPVDHWIAFVLLGFVGGRMFYSGMRSSCREYPVEEDWTRGRKLLALSLGTSIDAMVVGGSFTAMGLHPLYTSLIIGGVTFGVCMVGVYIAGKASCLRRDILEMAGGSVLIMIGIKVLFEHRDHIFRF